ncbi:MULTISPECIES: hypothetical protein [Serratia]|uniref:hypothetical protein n=1 Tax=Serratia TaxID=613 RepID=UPI0005614951|nr:MULTISPECIES: hypothetical protein [Serratia]QHI77497.1 hypothetical protein GUC32_07900 [Serratia sp. NGAS9]HEJ7890043.1 hypothetical protein [Serratia liquefaciens]ANJ91935.1 hypothetical protein ADP72_02530 [Serratia plymuthica]AVN32985.1 hypothetical protein AM470_06285 [Serratia marcescens]MBH1913335.1 hypothetical protein [Serratia ureilytica]
MLDSDIDDVKSLLSGLNRILDNIEKPIQNSPHAEELKELHIALGVKLNEKIPVTHKTIIEFF